jgi:hypothetical protein
MYRSWFAFIKSFCMPALQELRCREEELTKAALQQKIQEELLKKREQELASREIDLLERELNILILQQVMHKPTPRKRKKGGKIRLKHIKSGGKAISEPSGQSFHRDLFMSRGHCISVCGERSTVKPVK